jgi:hypothetical protein
MTLAIQDLVVLKIVHSNGSVEGTRELADDSGCIEFKQSPEWVSAFRDVKQVLADREYVLKKSELR